MRVGWSAVSALTPLLAQLLARSLRQLYGHLSSGSRARNAGALSLLAAVAGRGRSLAWELLRSFDWSLPALATLAQPPRASDGPKALAAARATRAALGALTLALLAQPDGALRRAALAHKPLLGALLRGLASDPPGDACRALAAVRHNLLARDSGVPPRLRAAVFSDAAVDALVAVSAAAAGDAASEDATAAAAHANAVLTALLSDASNGLVSDEPAEEEGGATSSRHADTHARAMRVMRRLRVSEAAAHGEMLVAAVTLRPQLAGAYLAALPFSLEPRASPRWFAAVTLVARLVRIAARAPLQPPVAAAAAAAAPAAAPAAFAAPTPQPGAVATARRVVPPALGRAPMTRALAHGDPLVRHAASLSLLSSLRALQETLERARGGLEEGQAGRDAWAAWRTALRDGVRDCLPDPQAFFALVAASEQHPPPAVAARAAHGSQVDADAEGDGLPTRSNALSALALFRCLLPDAFAAFAAAHFDPTRLLPSQTHRLREMSAQELLPALDVLLAFAGATAAASDDAPAVALPGARETAPGHLTALLYLRQADGAGADESVANRAAALLRLRLLAAGCVACQPEADIWLRALPSNSPVAAAFLAEAVASCARRGDATLARAATMALAGGAGDPVTQASVLALTAVESALKVCSSERRPLGDRLAVSLFVSGATTTLLACQQQPAALAAVIAAATPSLGDSGPAFAPLRALRRLAHSILLAALVTADSDAQMPDAHDGEPQEDGTAALDAALGRCAGGCAGSEADEARAEALAAACVTPSALLAPRIRRLCDAVGAETLAAALLAMPHARVDGSCPSSLFSSFFTLAPAVAALNEAEAVCTATASGAGSQLDCAARRVPEQLRPCAARACAFWAARAASTLAARALCGSLEALLLEAEADGNGGAAGTEKSAHWPAALAALTHPWLVGRYTAQPGGESPARSAALDEATTRLLCRLCAALDGSRAAAAALHGDAITRDAVARAAEALSGAAATALCCELRAGAPASSAAHSDALAGAAAALLPRAPAELRARALRALLPGSRAALLLLPARWAPVAAQLAEEALRLAASHEVVVAPLWRGLLLRCAEEGPGGAAEAAAARALGRTPHLACLSATEQLARRCMAAPGGHGGASAAAVTALVAHSAAHCALLCATLLDAATPTRHVILLLPAAAAAMQGALAMEAPPEDARALATSLQPLLCAHFQAGGCDAQGAELAGALAHAHEEEVEGGAEARLVLQTLRAHAVPALLAALDLCAPPKALRRALIEALVPDGGAWRLPKRASSQDAGASVSERCALAFSLAGRRGARASRLRPRVIAAALRSLGALWRHPARPGSPALAQALLSHLCAALPAWSPALGGGPGDARAQLAAAALDFARAAVAHGAHWDARPLDLAAALFEALGGASQRDADAAADELGDGGDAAGVAAAARALFDHLAADSRVEACLFEPRAGPPPLPTGAARRTALPPPSLLPFVAALEEADCEEDMPEHTSEQEAGDEVCRQVKRALCRLLSACLTAQSRCPDASWQPGGDLGARALVRRLLCCYHASAHACDQALLAAIGLLEALQPGAVASVGHLWGAAAAHALRLVATPDDDVAPEQAAAALRDAAPPDARRACLACLAAPRQPTASSCAAYDPAFLLPATAHSLASGAMGVRDAVAWGLLPLALAALSSEQELLRAPAYATLAAALGALERAGQECEAAAAGAGARGHRMAFREQPQVAALLLAVRACVTEPLQRLPGVSCVFAAEACLVSLHPEAQLYAHCNRALLRSPALDLDAFPLLLPLLHSGDADAWRPERTAALRFARAAVASHVDGELARRAYACELLMASAGASTCDAASRRETLRSLGGLLGVETYAVHAVDHSGVVSWLAATAAAAARQREPAAAAEAARVLCRVLLAHPGVRLRAGDAARGAFAAAAAALAHAAAGAPNCGLLLHALGTYRHLLACRLEQRGGAPRRGCASSSSQLLTLPALRRLAEASSRAQQPRVRHAALMLLLEATPGACGGGARMRPASDALALAALLAWAAPAAIAAGASDGEPSAALRLLSWTSAWLREGALATSLGGEATGVARAAMALHASLPPTHGCSAAALWALVTTLLVLQRCQVPGVARSPAFAHVLGDTLPRLLERLPDLGAPHTDVAADAQAPLLLLVDLLRGLWAGAAQPHAPLHTLAAWAACAQAAPGGEPARAWACGELQRLEAHGCAMEALTEAEVEGGETVVGSKRAGVDARGEVKRRKRVTVV